MNRCYTLSGIMIKTMSNRKEFLKQSSLLIGMSLIPGIAQTNNGSAKQPVLPDRIIPQGLKKGDTIGLVTPAAPVKEKTFLAAVRKVESLGFKVYYLPSVLSRYGYFAGSDQQRADELMHMFANPEVQGIMCVRGGYGTSRILDLLDYSLIRQNPKVFSGYSDVTAIHIAIGMNTGLVTYHGLMGVSDFNEFATGSFMDIVAVPKQKYRYPYLRESETADNPEFDKYTIAGGKAKGLLTGGNLTLLASLAGTNYEPDFKDKIVFIEEIEELTHRVDRMMIQLLMGTNLKKASGIVLGVFSECNKDDESSFLSLKEALSDILVPLNIPVAYGFPFGHIDNKVTIPYGIMARMNAGKNRLILLEPTAS